MKFTPKFKFAIVGHGLSLFNFYKQLKKYKFPDPILITHEKKYHKRDLNEYSGFKNLYYDISLLNNKIKIFYIKDINNHKVIDILLENKVDYIFSFSSRFLFKRKLLNQFKNRVFNIHSSFLPEERGGGVFTYRILRSRFFCSSTIHIVNEDIDSGDIILQSRKKAISKNSLPINFIDTTTKINSKLTNTFLQKLDKKKEFKTTHQSNKVYSYLPRFYTEKMALIDWSFKGKDISSLIQACSKPYKGASTKINLKNKKIKLHILKAKFFKDKNSHPILSGKIFFHSNTHIKVFVSDGYLMIYYKDIVFSGLNKRKVNLNLLGKTLYNSYNDLEESKKYIANVFKFK